MVCPQRGGFPVVSIVNLSARSIALRYTFPGKDPVVLRLAGRVAVLVLCCTVFTLQSGCDEEDMMAVDVDVDVDVAEPAPEARLVISPSPVDFGRVAAGTTASAEVSLINLGTIPVSITEVFPLDPSGEFTVDAADLDALPYPLAPNQTWVIAVDYAPLNDNRDEIPLDVQYRANDGRLENVEVILEANGAEPCLVVEHEEGFEFVRRLVNQSHTETFTITNCSTGDYARDLDISSVSLLNTAEQASSPLFALANTPVLPLVLPPAGSVTFDVTYSPTEIDVTERAFLEILSNDSVKDPLVIEISGSATDNECPVAVARCAVSGKAGLPSTSVVANGWSTVECFANGSFDPDGTIEGYEWRLSTSDSSRSTMEPPDEEATSFLIDFPGVFTVYLDVFDDKGADSCVPSRVEVASWGTDLLGVELSWQYLEGPEDEAEGSGGPPDVALHVLQAGRGCWNSIPWDCHWRNTDPDWGMPGGVRDNPNFELYEGDGYSTQSVFIQDGAPTTYRVGVEYVNNRGRGAVAATVTVYVFGSIAFQRSRELVNRGEFWEVVEGTWPDGELSFTDRTWPSIEAAPCR
jgi:hypothetical protein